MSGNSDVMSTVRSVADLYSWKPTIRTMATEATFTVPSDQFPLGTVFTQLPNVTVTLERLIPAQDLTEAVLKHNHQTPLTEVSEDVLTEIRLSLSHVHIPKLASEGLINYAPERKLVAPIKQLDQIQPTLSTILDAGPTLDAAMEL